MDVAKLDARLNQLINEGKALDGFEEFYADDVVMQENSDDPFVGKELNRKREHEFFGSIESFNSGEMLASAVNGDTSFAQWSWDVTFKGGHRVVLNQVSVRTWKDGKVVFERFYYNK